MPYSPINQVKSHSIIVEDERLREKTYYEGELATEMAREREALAARGPQPSILERIRRLVRR